MKSVSCFTLISFSKPKAARLTDETKLVRVQVVQILKGEGGIVDQLKQKSSVVRSLVLEACDLEDYTCSNYLSDLNRHRQLVMDQ